MKRFSVMKNRIISSVLALVMAVLVFVSMCDGITAATYSESLKELGFPDSYISKLVTLHEKYPNWTFKPFVTNLDWDTAVKGERKPHDQQLVQKRSGISSSNYCNCSSCYKNGSYVIQEGSTWVSASKSTVEKYMDPRNSLDEKHIFQFESTSYDSSQKASGVESILKGTWMYDSNIQYYNASGTQKYVTINDAKVKYSTAIITAAKDSGMSAYYLASKMRQEVGGTTPTAGGASGKKAPFEGIYNYYNIGAYSTASQGLEWANGFLRTTEATPLYKTYDSTTKKVSTKIKDLAVAQYLVYIGSSGNYYKVKLYSESSSGYSGGETGYVLKSKCRTTYFTYERPWTNPYKCIVGGAKYIAKSFSSYQNTGYLQKFNVNSASGNLYGHEYMANVEAAYDESVTTYNAYKNAGILTGSKTFYIPVFKNMSNDSSSTTTTSSTSTSTTSTNTVTGLKMKSRTTSSITIEFNSVSKASKYYVWVKNLSTGNTFSKTVTTNSASLNNLTSMKAYQIKVRAYKSNKWQPYSSAISVLTKPGKVANLKVSSIKSTSSKVSWDKKNGVSGYYVQIATNSEFTKGKQGFVVKGSNTLYKSLSNLEKGTTYYVRLRAYKTYDSKKVYGSYTAYKSFKTTGTKISKVTGLKVTSVDKTTIKISYDKYSNASKYYIWIKNTSTGNVFSKTVTTNTASLNNLTSKKTYEIKVKAYAKDKWTSYSSAVTQKTN